MSRDVPEAKHRYFVELLSAKPWNEAFPGLYIGNAGMVRTRRLRRIGTVESGHLENFATRCAAALDRIASQPIGLDLLTLISKRCQGIGARKGLQVIICCANYFTHEYKSISLDEQGGFGNTSAQPFGLIGTHTDIRGHASPVERRFNGGTIKVSAGGASSRVLWSPFVDYDRISVHDDSLGFVSLAHELIHAYHHLSGNMKTRRYVSGSKEADEEELFTVGLGKFQSTRISENKIRAEHGLAERQYYYTMEDRCQFMTEVAQ